jgi:hypothetical protein
MKVQPPTLSTLAVALCLLGPACATTPPPPPRLERRIERIRKPTPAEVERARQHETNMKLYGTGPGGEVCRVRPFTGQNRKRLVCQDATEYERAMRGIQDWYKSATASPDGNPDLGSHSSPVAMDTSAIGSISPRKPTSGSSSDAPELDARPLTLVPDGPDACTPGNGRATLAGEVFVRGPRGQRDVLPGHRVWALPATARAVEQVEQALAEGKPFIPSDACVDQSARITRTDPGGQYVLEGLRAGPYLLVSSYQPPPPTPEGPTPEAFTMAAYLELSEGDAMVVNFEVH